MALPKVSEGGIALGNVDIVQAGGKWVSVKRGTFEEKTEGYAFESVDGKKYFVTQYGVTFTQLTP